MNPSIKLHLPLIQSSKYPPPSLLSIMKPLPPPPPTPRAKKELGPGHSHDTAASARRRAPTPVLHSVFVYILHNTHVTLHVYNITDTLYLIYHTPPPSIVGSLVGAVCSLLQRVYKT